MKIFTNHTDTFVAPSLEHIPVLIHAHYGMTMEEEGWTLDEWSQVDDDKVITIHNFHGWGDNDVVSKTAAEWAVLEPPGMLCSTEY